MSRQVDAVLFDLGQVLVRWDPYLPFQGHHAREAVERFFREIDFPAFNHLQDAGRPMAEARAALQVSHPEHVALFDHYVEHFADAVPGEVPGARRLVEEVRVAGLRVLGLTNWSAENFHVASAKAAPVLDLLEGVMVSGQVRLAKPDPRVFRLAAERFGLDPARTLFTDDSPANVAAAQHCGFRGVLFREPDDVRTRLLELGVDVDPHRPAAERRPAARSGDPT